MPEKNVPYNYFMIAIAENYYKIKEYEKGNEIIKSLVDLYEDDLEYYTSLKTSDRKKLQEEMDRAKYILQQLIVMTNERYKESGMKKDMEQRFTSINSLLMQP